MSAPRPGTFADRIGASCAPLPPFAFWRRVAPWRASLLSTFFRLLREQVCACRSVESATLRL
eukprot:3890691-Pleurochrysis_carterae.AAC.1